MASLLPGFEYDIFISYRQKDNKGDSWGSEFVDALKTELEYLTKMSIKKVSLIWQGMYLLHKCLGSCVSCYRELTQPILNTYN